MKRNLLILLGFAIALNLNAQGIKKRIADRNFNRFHYAYSIKHLVKLVKLDSTDTELKEKLAFCYRKVNDSRNAEYWYKKILSVPNTNPVNKLYLAEALAINKKYDESKAWYEKYSEDVSGDARGYAFAKAYNSIGQFYLDSSAYSIQTVNFNSSQLDFSPAYYKKGIVFSSNRKKSSPVSYIFAWDVTNYLDLYYVNDDNSEPVKIKGDINTKFHEGSACFTKTEDTIIFTRTNYFKGKLGKSDDDIHKLKLYMAVMNDGKWTDVQELPFNSEQYSVGQPCFNKEGNRLFFVSDMPGSSGGTDIYFAEYKNGQWGKPVNMGKNINSEGNEMFPFVDKNNNLYFASNGLPGLGGLDIFCSLYKNGSYEKPFNTGYPLNTNKDDFGIIFNEKMDGGYFTSSRGAGGDDDIYKFVELPRKINIFVYDKETNMPVEGADVAIVKGSNMIVEDKTDESGNLKLTLPPETDMNIIAGKEYYYSDSLKLTYSELMRTNRIKIPLRKTEVNITLAGYVSDADNTSNAIAGAVAVIKDASTGLVVDSTASDVAGNFSLVLAPDKKYLVEVTKPDADGERCSKATAGVSTDGIMTSRVIHENFPVYCIGDIVKIENIYYDFDKYVIRPDAALELDKLYAILVKYPLMKIELRSHTDSRGNSQYNWELSDWRAKYAVKYLVEKGIAENRMVAQGYGESVPVNKCADGVICTNTQHQENRRTEFKILDIK